MGEDNRFKKRRKEGKGRQSVSSPLVLDALEPRNILFQNHSIFYQLNDNNNDNAGG